MRRWNVSRMPMKWYDSIFSGEDRAFSVCTEKWVYDRGTTGAEHGKDESVDTDVFGHSGIHNEPDVYSADTSRTSLYDTV
jgi:hypothetical protein